MSEECSDNELGSLFAAFDKDADGRISVAELQLCMRETLGEDVSTEALMASVDVDGDGLLDATEFARLVQDQDDSTDARLTTNVSAQAPPSLRNCFYTSFASPS
jgi:calcium-binding protein CML